MADKTSAFHKLPAQSDGWNFVSQSQAAEWFDGLPVGNGDLGALMLASQQQISFNLAKSDLWTIECDDGSGKPGSCYPFHTFGELQSLIERQDWDAIDDQYAKTRATWKGHFALRSAGVLVLNTSRFEKEIELLDFKRHLAMDTAAAHNLFHTRVREQHVESLVSVDHQVLMIRVRCNLDWRKGNPPRKMNFGMDVRLDQPSLSAGAGVSLERKANLICQVIKTPQDEHAIAVMVDGKGIECSPHGDGLEVTGRRQVDFTLMLAIARGEGAAASAIRRVKEAHATGYHRVSRQHRKWWGDFWNKSAVTIPDQRILRQYHFGLYLLGSSSRQGYQMPGLQGLWHTRKPGSMWNDYTNDLNIQMNYWPCYTSNHLEVTWPYYDTVRQWLPELRTYAQRYWQCRGVQFSCCSSPSGLVPIAYLTTMHWAGCGAFVAQNFWTHFLYSRDTAFLRDVAYPFLKECAEFYIDFLKLSKRGCYEIWPSNNPEAGEGSYEAWGKNPAVDIALLRMLFKAVVQSAEILGIDADFAEACQARLDGLPPYPMRDGAIMDMESKEFDYSHRHNGVIMPIYPCDEVDEPTAKRTIKRFMGKGRWLWGCHTVPWQVGAFARLRDAHTAHQLLEYMFDAYLPRDGGFNLNFNYHRHPDGIIGPAVFCNESNSGFSAALLEMLIQSHRNIIRLFPATPADWKQVEIRHLRAEGGFLVSANRKNGQTNQVRIESTVGGTVQLQLPWNGRSVVYQDRKQVSSAQRRGLLKWETQSGASYIVRPCRPQIGTKVGTVIKPRRQ